MTPACPRCGGETFEGKKPGDKPGFRCKRRGCGGMVLKPLTRHPYVLCPNCDGPTLDNRGLETKSQPASFICADKQCSGRILPEFLKFYLKEGRDA